MAGVLRLLWAFIEDCFRSPKQLRAENTVLRHQLNILQRKMPWRPNLSGVDRALFVWLCRRLNRLGKTDIERVIGSIRRECLDHLIVRNEADLRRVLRAYALYYNATRTHLGLQKDTPNRRPIERRGRVVACEVLGGLHHQYNRM